MNAAGIDVSNRKSMVTVLRPFGEVVMLPLKVRHNAERLLHLAQALKKLDGETRIVMEHGLLLRTHSHVLHDVGLFFSAVNPLLIKEYDGNSLYKIRTGKADVVKIA